MFSNFEVKLTMKKLLFTCFLIITTNFMFSQNNTLRIKFLKGNIAEKTAAVREASGNDAIWLSNKAIEFSLENKTILGNDRDLDGLAVAAILSISPEYVKSTTEINKTNLSNQFVQLFNNFTTSSTVQIAVLSKTVALKDYISTKEFTEVLNNYLFTINIATADTSVFKSILNALEVIGNNNSFSILYSFYNNPKFKNYNKEIEKTIVALIPTAMNEVLSIIYDSDLEKITNLFELISKNSNISKNNLCEISENVLSQSILILDNSSKNTSMDFTLQLSALKILADNKWTRASSIALSYFQFAKKQFTNSVMTVFQFEEVIKTLSSISPIDAVLPLTAYLEELNALTENETAVSEEIVMAVINTLGAIGDKSAFDSLLAVTYLNYPESVLSAAREALSGLRWQ